MRVISLGWGTQSFALAAMVALGELPPVDAAIHADTTHEAAGTYAFASTWTPWLEARGVRVVTVRANKPAPILTWRKGPVVQIPAFTSVNNRRGVIQRHCTGDWKIDPIKKWLTANRKGATVEQLIGITIDEITRMKPSRVAYMTHGYPLIERNLTRENCRDWLAARGLAIPPRSACVFCPFHSRREWAEIKESSDWSKAVEVDESIREARLPGELFLHSSRIPLRLVDLRSDQDKGQLELWDAECSGMCGI